MRLEARRPKHHFPVLKPPEVRGYDEDFSGSKHPDNIENCEFRGASLGMLWRPHVVLTIVGQVLAMLLVLPSALLAQSTLHTGDTLQVTFSVPSGLSFTPNVIDLGIGSVSQTCTVVNATEGSQTQTSQLFNGTVLLGTYSATSQCAFAGSKPALLTLSRILAAARFCYPAEVPCAAQLSTSPLSSMVRSVE